MNNKNEDFFVYEWSRFKEALLKNNNIFVGKDQNSDFIHFDKLIMEKIWNHNNFKCIISYNSGHGRVNISNHTIYIYPSPFILETHGIKLSSALFMKYFVDKLIVFLKNHNPDIVHTKMYSKDYNATLNFEKEEEDEEEDEEEEEEE